MKLALDTCTFLWLILDAPELSPAARDAIQNPDNDVLLSAVSAWEISLKYALKRLPLPAPPDIFVPRMRQAHGIEPIEVDEEAALHLHRLPDLHRDPFDRMLVCQALVHGLTVLTPDEQIRQYACRTLW